MPRSKLAVALAALGSGGLVLALLLGCETVLSPTPCDDWCRATLRADCPQDFPHTCVADCAKPTAIDVISLCFSNWDALRLCYQNSPDSAFLCGGQEKSIPGTGLCSQESANLESCASVLPETSRCFRLCAEASNAGLDFPLRSVCDRFCAGGETACSVPFGLLFQCLLTDCPSEQLIDCLVPGATPVCVREQNSLVSCQQEAAAAAAANAQSDPPDTAGAPLGATPAP